MLVWHPWDLGWLIWINDSQVNYVGRIYSILSLSTVSIATVIADMTTSSDIDDPMDDKLIGAYKSGSSGIPQVASLLSFL